MRTKDYFLLVISEISKLNEEKFVHLMKANEAMPGRKPAQLLQFAKEFEKIGYLRINNTFFVRLTKRGKERVEQLENKDD